MFDRMFSTFMVTCMIIAGVGILAFAVPSNYSKTVVGTPVAHATYEQYLALWKRVAVLEKAVKELQNKLEEMEPAAIVQGGE